eukprot:9525432-Heterocapsa_arctica.AAC.1
MGCGASALRSGGSRRGRPEEQYDVVPASHAGFQPRKPVMQGLSLESLRHSGSQAARQGGGAQTKQNPEICARPLYFNSFQLESQPASQP